MIDYYLPNHVHFCCRGDALVFLDLRRDDYTLVNGAAARAIQELSLSQRQEIQTPDAHVALKELLEGGLLTTDAGCGRKIAATQIQVAVEPLIDSDTAPEVRILPSDVVHFVYACVVAAILLRWWHIESVVQKVRQRHPMRDSGDLCKARELTAKFRKLRALFPRDYLCLYDSLALLEFLSCYGVFPRWVFGVRLEPWAAHCWVQDADFVFDEDVEAAANYTPVMVV